MLSKAFKLYKLNRQVLGNRKSIYKCDKYVYFKLLNAHMITRNIKVNFSFIFMH